MAENKKYVVYYTSTINQPLNVKSSRDMIHYTITLFCR
jgi:hypothetical protein